MTMVAEKTVALSWDHFLGQAEEGSARAIETFRRINWPQIQRMLREEYQVEVAEDQEPHWVGPGLAVLWKEEKVSQPVEKVEENGRRFRVLEETSVGFKPSAHLPVGTASQLAAYLKKGFQFRPPSQEVEDAVESAAPPEASSVKSAYTCKRHPTRSGMGFVNWKAYLRHCDRFNEGVEYAPPPEVIKGYAGYEYVCYLHGFATHDRRLAQHHARESSRKQMTRGHASLEQMMAKPAVEEPAPLYVSPNPQKKKKSKRGKQ